MKKWIIGILAAMVLVLAIVGGTVPVTAGDEKVDICHYAEGQGGKFNLLNVDGDSILKNGHGDHEEDVIPSFRYDISTSGNHYYINDLGAYTYPGLNWDAVGQALLAMGCTSPTVTSTPTVTATPTATLTSTPTATATEEPTVTPTATELPPAGNEASPLENAAPWRIGAYTWAGHAKGAFANVLAMQVGDIFLFDGKLYRVYARVIVNPDATQMVDRPGYDLELVTCIDQNDATGVWEHRLFILAMEEK